MFAPPEQQFAEDPWSYVPMAMQPHVPVFEAPEQQLDAVPLSGDWYAMHEQLPNASVLPGQQFSPFPWSPALAMQPQDEPLTVPEQQSDALPSLALL